MTKNPSEPVIDNERFSLTDDGIPFSPRLCFNWLPQYRYGLFAYKALQRACFSSITNNGNGYEMSPSARTTGEHGLELEYVRPILIDSVIRHEDWHGYVSSQCEKQLESFFSGLQYFPITEDMAVIIAKEHGTEELLNNILSYMTPAPQSLIALLSIGGGYAGADEQKVVEAHRNRRDAVDLLRQELARRFGMSSIDAIRVHSAGVGGLIEAATRCLHFKSPGFKSCILVPEYWDLLRCVLTYSPQGLRVVEGRDDPDFDPDTWLSALSLRDLDFAYVSYTSNPLGNTLSKGLIHDALEAVPDDTLFFLDSTSIDIHLSNSVEALSEFVTAFSHKNLMIAKSFSKEFNRSHLRVGYAVFTRPETAQEIWPYMSAYPPAAVSHELLICLNNGNERIINEYRRLNRLLTQQLSSHPCVRATGTSSNYTTICFENETECTRALEALQSEYGSSVYPGELPMQGGGRDGLGQGEVSLSSMKRIPYLSPRCLRLLVTEQSIRSFFSVLGRLK